jgi:hypothetical protein
MITKGIYMEKKKLKIFGEEAREQSANKINNVPFAKKKISSFEFSAKHLRAEMHTDLFFYELSEQTVGVFVKFAEASEKLISKYYDTSIKEILLMRDDRKDSKKFAEKFVFEPVNAKISKVSSSLRSVWKMNVKKPKDEEDYMNIVKAALHASNEIHSSFVESSKSFEKFVAVFRKMAERISGEEYLRIVSLASTVETLFLKCCSLYEDAMGMANSDIPSELF